ncbi:MULTISPECIES: hypothetical protein [unclassified Curtobacterium]|uniref:hypothetical protein n=1 Tax=unclassified Curtobacterium TaxID=257496 RepID=UPI0011B7D0ED|nr:MULTISPECIES: hypothetical protein [unclassified Curtobacterium]
MTNIWYHPPAGHVVMEGEFPSQHWVLQLIADFSVLQSTVELAIDQKLALSAPAVAKVISKKYLRKLPDDDRWALVKALAADTKYEGDMVAASDVFWQAKRTRDLFAHRSDLPLVREPNSSQYFYLVSGNIPVGLPSPLTPSDARQMSANCRWLRALVLHLASLGGARFASFLVKHGSDGRAYLPRVEVLPPPPLPVPPDWEALDLSREVGDSGVPVAQNADDVEFRFNNES